MDRIVVWIVVSFVLKSLVPTESTQDKENFPIRSRHPENFPKWKLAFRMTVTEGHGKLVHVHVFPNLI